MVKNSNAKNLALRTGAILVYFLSVSVLIGPRVMSLFSLKDLSILVVGVPLFYVISLREIKPGKITPRIVLAVLRKSTMISGMYGSIILLVIFFSAPESLESMSEAQSGGHFIRLLFFQVKPFLYSIPLFLLLPNGGEIDDDTAKADGIAVLTRREKEIAGLIQEGLTNSEIGKKLFISEYTVKKHVYNIFTKLHINHRSEIKEMKAQG